MQLAIALSQSEAQAKEEQKKRITSSSTVPGLKGASSSLTSLEPKVLHLKKIDYNIYNIHVTFKICLNSFVTSYSNFPFSKVEHFKLLSHQMKSVLN